ncbi:MAG: replication-associated recombination protein A, partial [Deltaproteobacteria bacterium]
VYYTARLIEAGEAPRFVLRRLIIFASEDIGLADPQALVQATAALTAFDMVGLPEGTLPMTQAALYLACAPKSRTVVQTYAAAQARVAAHGTLPVPMWLRPGALGDAGCRHNNLPAELATLPGAAPLFEPSGQGMEARIVAAWRGRQHINEGRGPLGNAATK